MPELVKLKWLAHQDMANLLKQYVNTGNTESAGRLAQTGLALANRLNSGESAKLTMNQLTGIAIEALTLRELDQNTSNDFLAGKTPNERTEELKQQRSSYDTLYKSFFDAYSNATEAELLSYYDRVKLNGQEKAMRWFMAKQGKP